MNKKYALTGHTQGIGEHLFKILNPNVIGFSRSTGFDINRKEDRLKIIDQVRECNVFINNAHSNFSQINLFLELLQIWYFDSSKTIINVGSNITDFQLDQKSVNLMFYQAEKISLKEISFKLPKDIKCNVIYKSFGYVGTKKILKKYPHFSEKNYISIENACKIILS